MLRIASWLRRSLATRDGAMHVASALSPPPTRFAPRVVSRGNRIRSASFGGPLRKVINGRSSKYFGRDNGISGTSSSRLAVASAKTDVSSSTAVDTNGVAMDDFETFIMDLQSDLCSNLERMDREGFGNDEVQRDESVKSSGSFTKDVYSRPGDKSGFGVTRVLENGAVFEKAAANVSIIRGVLSPERAKAMSSRGRECVDPNGGQEYSAAALSLGFWYDPVRIPHHPVRFGIPHHPIVSDPDLSIVFHPRSPFVPTFRADIRRFNVAGVSWYGGGADLTPYYLFDDDATAFHGFYRQLCNEHDPDFSDDAKNKKANNSGPLHLTCKKWCDEYFFIPARREHRGVGGVFFDDVVDNRSGDESSDVDKKSVVPINADLFTKAIGSNWISSYEPIVKKRWEVPYKSENEKWHHQRRGRYVEFNLLYDRGVRFGLDGGRVESIMVSAPPRVRWDYDVTPEPGSEEERLVEVLREPREW